ncbi:uncharacterized protein LOC103314369 isoform X1 [Tribolium castaneum]|uniref:uncharacterized protein LOC103314369 isoform X1 n=1 Tax=Tribolium castaneum TaxID=7070 RepID=UPI00046C179F|nr:PREDICTED: uncharacterized protein LOC103314369 isoform X1 [Tribolium castaneum]XP_015839237.1 PREDICTED: uncharacterized protein LOC103314369 isoform X1 [Tribolium castaneum]|eukprot:XP_008198497.1 PREDICTED: uncharacterized protein LOC103314369 isoform X1 [Tribolium castaneum]
MTTQLLGKNCDGGHYTCSPPKDCCKQGCCFLLTPAVHRPPAIPPANFFNPLFLGHWYFWVAVTATVAGILCACSLWRRHNQGSFCCRDSGRDERASEPDSNGSCYAPPQYSRCNSFHQPPPPYSEVTSKPDLYPLVISYNGDPVIKNNNSSTGYLMVQYFRNFIVRPVVTFSGSLSATSTIDSLSSSFICNAANEANTIIPPPYSCMGSLEEVTTENNQSVQSPEPPQIPQSASGDFLPTPSTHTNPPTPISISIRDNPCFGQNATNIVNNLNETLPNLEPSKCQTNCDASPYKKIKKPILQRLPKDRSQDSDEDHNFSDLLNLSVCVPSSVVNLGASIQSSHLQELQYSVTNSMTGSDISSLANLGSPDSPPRATSPTLEMRELLDKIQQLPQQKSPQPPKTSRVKAKTLYMPLYEGPKKGLKGWLSRSAPNTPCSNFAPSFPKKGSSQRSSRVVVGDGSPLLREYEEDANRDECL